MSRIKISFSGGDAHPDNVRISDLFSLARAVESAVSALGRARSDTERPSVCLHSIQPGSLNIEFTILDGRTSQRFFRAGPSISRGVLSGLPGQTVDGLIAIQEFAARHDCRARISNPRARSKSGGFEITKDTELRRPGSITGQTEITCEILRAGGVSSAARVRLMNGDILSCKCSKSIAQALGSRLYKEATLKGEAEWDLASGKIIKFTVSDCAEFTPRDPVVAFDELRSRFGKFFKNVDPTKIGRD